MIDHRSRFWSDLRNPFVGRDLRFHRSGDECCTDGLNLHPSSGVIIGLLMNAGVFPFTVQVANDCLTASADLSIGVYPFLNATTTSLPDGQVGVFYRQSLTATGGDGSYTWSIIAGGLPAGLSLVPSTGLISGTPTTAGTSNFTVQVVSGDAQTATAVLSIEIQLSP